MATTDNLVKLGQLQISLQRVKTELDALDGKPILVLAVKGDNTTNPTLTYSFINLEKLVDTYTAANAGISIAGYSVGVQLSQDAGNLLELENDGLFVGSDDTKVDKVTSAVTDNFAIFGASGAVVDSGFTIAGGFCSQLHAY